MSADGDVSGGCGDGDSGGKGDGDSDGCSKCATLAYQGPIASCLLAPLLPFVSCSPAVCCIACCRVPLPRVTFCRAAAARVQTMATIRRTITIVVDVIARRAVAIVIAVHNAVAVRRGVAIVIVDVVVRRAVAIVVDVVIHRAVAIIVVDFVVRRRGRR